MGRFLLACSQQERAQAYIWLFALGGWSLEKRNPASVLFNMRWINDLVVGLSAAVLGPRNSWPELLELCACVKRELPTSGKRG